MDITHYWPIAREYSVWNAAIATLQFGWHISIFTSSAMPLKESTQQAFFCHDSAQQLRNISEEVLFGYFVTILNDTLKEN